ncbi:MAG: InlB B-repeat-containing protein [Paludibacteraceae bacterium]|nr:InlB B-repeat-containing protein [Paludibacteraceae bacterium]
MKKLTKFLTVFLLALLGANLQPAWADNEGWFQNGMWQVWGYKTGYDSDGWLKTGMGSGDDFSVGIVTDGSYTIKGLGVKTWGSSADGVHCYYALPDGTQGNSWVNWNNGESDKYWESTGIWNYTLTSAGVGNHEINLYLKINVKNAGELHENNRKITWTVPGFKKTTASQTGFSAALDGEGQSKTISFTQHYGTALSTSNCKLTGTNPGDFKVTGISETEVTVEFIPTSSTGSKSATLTITDAHSKTCTITLSGTATERKYYIKHTWGDTNWSWKELTDNGNGTYSVSAKYGATGCDWNTKQNDDGKRYIGEPTLVNTPADGDMCIFTLNPTAGTITITPKTYTLTLDGNGGTPETQDVTVTYGKTCPSYTIPEKEGYSYKGYYNATTGTVQVILTTQNFGKNKSGWTNNNSAWIKDDNATVYAQWKANTYKVQFEKNGATSGTDHQQQSFTYDADEVALTSIESLGYGKTGYHFKGWATTSDGNVVYADQQQVKNLTAKAETIKVYAIWAPDTTVITLNRNYNRDGVDSNPGEYKAVYDATFTQFAKNTDFIREGYTFTGYKADFNNSGSAGIINVVSGDPITYAFPQSGTYGKSGNVWGYTGNTLTAYAYWTANQYTITLHYENETSPGTENKSVTFDATATAVTKPSYGTNVFNGYFTQATGGVQVINADGAFVPNVDGYTSNGNWVRASDVDLYAQWTTRTACTITYGVTDGTLAVSTRGTIKAKIGDGSYTSTGSLAVYTGDVVTIEYSPKSGQYYTSNNGYEANGWYSAASGGSSLPATHKNDYTFTVTGSASVYVKADPVVYTISTAVAPASTTVYPEGTGTVTPSEGSAGPDVALQLTAAEQVGYDWVNWTLNDETNGKIVTGTETDKTISVAAKAAGFTATANFTAHEYTITYHPNNGGADISEQYTIEAAHTLATNPERTDYTFDGWFDNAGFTGSAVTEIPQGTTGDKVYWAKWHETTYPVTIQTSTGIQSVTPSGEQQVGNVIPVDISAIVATGYTWSQWTSSNANVTITEPSNISTTIKATGEGTVTATATEKTVTLAPTVNDDDMGTVSGGGSVGIATGLQLTATKKNGYKFDHWVLSSNLIIQNSKTVNDYQITVKTNGNGLAVSAQAVFVEDLSTGVYLKGGGSFGGWDAAGFEFMKPTGQSTGNDAYVTIHTTSFEQFWMVEFAVIETNGNAMGANGWYFFNSTISTTFTHLTGKYTNPMFFSTVAGDYVFHYNTQTKVFDIQYPHDNCVALSHSDNSWTIYPLENNEATINLDGSKSYKFCVIYDGAMYANLKNITDSQKELQLYNNCESFNNKIWINTVKGGNYVFNFDHANDDHLSVTYPEESYQIVTVYEDGYTPKEVKVYEVSKPSITAKVPEGMNFNGWVTTGGATVADVNATTTTVTNAGTNGTVKATFNTKQYIYFKDGVYDKFGDVWANFRTSDYWDDKNGSGNKDLPYGLLKMTKIKNTDINYFRIADDKMSWDEVTNGIVLFTNKGNAQQNFYLTKVAYPHHNNSKSCYRACLPLFVPRDWITTNINSSQYYNDGIWMKYNSTESGFRIKGSWDSWTSNDYKFVAETPGGYEFKTTLHLDAGTTYGFKIYDDDNRTYSIKGVMTATSCTNWYMYMDQDNCQITTSEAGDYTFVLNLGSGEVIVSVEYPLSNDDYRVVAKQSSEVKWEGDLIKNSKNVAKKDTTSFFNNHYTYQLQQYAGENKWNNIGGEVTITDENAKVGVIDLIVTQDGTGQATLTYEGIYTGNYYIRTDGVDGGWGSYKTNPDNKMDNYGSLLVADPTYQYDVYKAKWVLSGKNVKFRIANDYSKAISDELKADAIIDNKETLPQGANVRFMWNSKTNQLKRAYISGSTDTKDRYLVLEGDAKMFDNEGNVIPVGTAGNHREGLLANELPFKDMNNWVYQADIKAQPGCAVKLTAKYNNNVQYFIGAEGTEPSSRKTIIAGSGTDKYTMRVVYDFKTNLLIAGWVPSDTIKSTISLGGDMLITRTHQDSAQQIIFGTTGSIEDIHHIYGVLSIKKDTMLGKGDAEKGAKYTTVATNADYDRTMYWVSFPFKVKISEIFGVDGYGTKWIMQKYRGDLRAQKGWFKEDTPTFWEYMDVTDSLNAYEGYLFLIDANYFNTEEADVWKNSATEANFYFPSASGNIGIINKSSFTQEVPENKCGIDRTFNVQDVGEVNHMNTDSYWNVIGVPAFQNKSMALSDTEVDTKMKAIYEWNSTNNTYTPRALQDQFRFQTMHAYMVQFGGDITWSDVSVVNNPTTAPYRYADTKNYFIKLFFGNNEAEDHAYINLADEASTDFVLNEDMMKLDNAGYPNIYSFAGNYNVAYNETKMTNQSVMIGVSAPKDGSYTFSMPKDFSGSAILVDLEEGTYTDLNVSNYSVDLNKGTYNNRFQLMLEVEAKTPTNIQNANGGLWSEDGKTQKLLINDQIYLINGGRVYNATGVQLR